MIIAFSHPPGDHAAQLLRGLRSELAPHDVLAWSTGEPAPVQDIQILLTLGAVPRQRVESLEQLELIQTLSAGYDSVDVEAADALGIWVSNAPAGLTGNAASVAEFAVMLLIGTSRHLTAALGADRSGTPMVVGSNRALSGKAVCIVGLGSVGRHLVDRLRPFAVRLIATDHGALPAPEDVTVFCAKDLKRAVATADYVVLCVPGSKANENLIDASVLDAMKRGSILINVARGSVVNEADLCAAMRSGQLAAIGLDVLRHEPPKSQDPLLGFPQALITPHIAGDTDLSLAGTIHFVGRLIAAWSDGGKPASIVNEPQKPRKVFAVRVAAPRLAVSP
jgi:phosphoglycerate dehydrogenase-like enzyme